MKKLIKWLVFPLVCLLLIALAPLSQGYKTQADGLISVTPTLNVNGAAITENLPDLPTYTQTSPSDTSFTVTLPTQVITQTTYVEYWVCSKDNQPYQPGSSVTFNYADFSENQSLVFTAHFHDRYHIQMGTTKIYSGSAPALTAADFPSYELKQDFGRSGTGSTPAYTFSYQDASFTTEGIKASSNAYDVLVSGWSMTLGDQDVSYQFILDATVTINPQDVTITVANATKFEWQDNPAFSYTVTGLVNSSDLGNITGVWGNSATPSTPGTYEISAAYTPSENYNVDVVKGTLTVKNAISVTPIFSLGSGTGNVPNYAPITQNASSGSTFTVTMPTVIPTTATSYVDYWYCEKTDTYYEPGQTVTFYFSDFIEDRSLSFSAHYQSYHSITLNLAKTYDGSVNSVSSANITGASIKNGKDSVPINYTSFTWEGTSYRLVLSEAQFAATTAQVSEQPSSLTVSGWKIVDASNNDVSYRFKLSANLTIVPRNVTITVADVTKYDWQTTPVFSYTQTGLVNNNDLGTITTVLESGVSASTPDSYEGAISVTYTQNPNYNVTIVKGDLFVRTAISVTPIFAMGNGTGNIPEYTANTQSASTGSTFSVTMPTVIPTSQAEYLDYWYCEKNGAHYAPGQQVTFDFSDFIDGANALTFTAHYHTYYTISLNLEKLYDGTVPSLSSENITESVIKLGQNIISTDYTSFTSEETSYSLILNKAVFTAGASHVSEQASSLSVTGWQVVDGSGNDVSYRFKLSAALSITPREVTITVADVTKLDRESTPVLTGTVTGLINDTDLGNIVYFFAGAYEDIAGIYPDGIAAIYAENKDYHVTVKCGTLTVIETAIAFVKYDLAGGTGKISDLNTYYIDDLAIPFTMTLAEIAPVKDGYYFTGWMVEGSDKLYHPGETISLYSTDYGHGTVTVTFTAQYIKLMTSEIRFLLYDDYSTTETVVQEDINQETFTVSFPQGLTHNGYRQYAWQTEDGTVIYPWDLLTYSFKDNPSLCFRALWALITEEGSAAFKPAVVYYLEEGHNYHLSEEDTLYYGGNSFYVSQELDATLTATDDK